MAGLIQEPPPALLLGATLRVLPLHRVSSLPFLLGALLLKLAITFPNLLDGALPLALAGLATLDFLANRPFALDLLLPQLLLPLLFDGTLLLLRRIPTLELTALSLPSLCLAALPLVALLLALAALALPVTALPVTALPTLAPPAFVEIALVAGLRQLHQPSAPPLVHGTGCPPGRPPSRLGGNRWSEACSQTGHDDKAGNPNLSHRVSSLAAAHAIRMSVPRFAVVRILSRIAALSCSRREPVPQTPPPAASTLMRRKKCAISAATQPAVRANSASNSPAWNGAST